MMVKVFLELPALRVTVGGHVRGDERDISFHNCKVHYLKIDPFETTVKFSLALLVEDQLLPKESPHRMRVCLCLCLRKKLLKPEIPLCMFLAHV
ncbi:Hypothetical predicted protein [Cloeon dipterum]|uniref:Uncharacterized protein n=1 Tax=Cloeon dipterum TaxID=197152 RepID=A0A8S1DJE8_9INSE|nr:Hypothetical predicted protein [Cloeon dipterum]